MWDFGKDGLLEVKAWMAMSSEMPVDHDLATVLGRGRNGERSWGLCRKERKKEGLHRGFQRVKFIVGLESLIFEIS